MIEATAQRAFDAPSAVAFSAGVPLAPVEREIRVRGAAGDLRAILYRREPRTGAPPPPVIMHMHGGGYTIMTPETAGRICRQLVESIDAIVVNILVPPGAGASVPGGGR